MAQGGVRPGLWLLVALVSACAAPEPKPAPPTPPDPSAPAPNAPAPPPPAAAPALQTPSPTPGTDACGASTLQHLIGKPHTDIPPPVYPSLRRVVCSTCVMTQDYQASRLTILFSAATGLITAVKCG